MLERQLGCLGLVRSRQIHLYDRIEIYLNGLLITVMMMLTIILIIIISIIVTIITTTISIVVVMIMITIITFIIRITITIKIMIEATPLLGISYIIISIVLNFKMNSKNNPNYEQSTTYFHISIHVSTNQIGQYVLFPQDQMPCDRSKDLGRCPRDTTLLKYKI